MYELLLLGRIEFSGNFLWFFKREPVLYQPFSHAASRVLFAKCLFDIRDNAFHFEVSRLGKMRFERTSFCVCKFGGTAPFRIIFRFVVGAVLLEVVFNRPWTQASQACQFFYRLAFIIAKNHENTLPFSSV